MRKRKLSVKNVSIRTRILLLFSTAMLIAILVTFLLIYLASASVMKKTLSEYLLSAVDSNADKLVFLTAKEAKKERKLDSDDIFIEYENGILRIDDDFLQILNDVESALFTGDGKLLYGESTRSNAMDGESFQESRLYEKRILGKRYLVYDRHFSEPGLETLWIRGIVPLTQQEVQLGQITKSVLAFLPLMLMLIIVSSVLSAAGILRPIQRMEQTAAVIVDGQDLEKRIDVGENRDELYSLAESFNAMFNRLERSFARERQFTSDASHELRTPLAVIQTQTEYILAKDRKPEEYKKAFAVVDRQAKRMKRLVSDLLDLSRIGQGHRRYPMCALDFSQIVRITCEDMERIGYAGITMETQLEEGIRLYGNRDLLERLLVNLLDNAYKYGRENGRIWVRLTGTKETQLEVADDGIGISTAAQEKIFDRFYREDSSRSSNGYGLGLSLVAEIVSLHGGKILVDSRQGEGSCFSVVFPALQDNHGDSEGI